MDKISVWKYAAVAGAAVGVVEVAYVMLMYFSHSMINGSPLLGFVSMILTYGAFVYALYYYKKNVSGATFTFGRGMKVGAMVSIFFALVVAAVSACIYMDNDLINEILLTQKSMYAKMNLPQESVDMAMSMSKKMMRPGSVFVMTFFGKIVSGLFVSLIAMLFLKENESYEEIK